MNTREASLADAVGLLLAGEWSAAALRLDRHSMSFPHDFLAIQSGQLIDFFRANARDMRDRIARVLPAWSPDMPLYGLLLGMHAFGLEECGDYQRAEEAGRRAINFDRRDCWAHHAIAHVMEMQGRAEDGVGWMIVREADWAGEDNFFRVHNWWHRALFHLSLEQTNAALAIHDEQVHGALNGIAVNLVDASALLWRLHLCGVDPGGRWLAVAEQWEAVADGALYPFNDWHAAMADLGAGRDEILAARIARMKAAASGAGETAQWIRDIGLPLVNGFVAFWRGDYPAAAEALHAARFISNAFGGSHAQRDVIDWTLGEAALRAGMRDLAIALAHERLALKPFNPLNNALLRRARE
jgi:tetratricopeptide (TPR) repeat protein